MPDAPAVRPDTNALNRTLATVDRRERVGRLVRLGVQALACVLGLLLLLAIGSRLGVVPVLVPWLLLGAAIAAGAAWAGFVLRRSVDTARAARLVDGRAGLHDELRSAEWFSGQDAGSPWVDLHLARAVRTASALDVERLVPIEAPAVARRASIVTAGALVLVVLLPSSWLPGGLVPAASLDGAERAGLEAIRDLLAERGGADELDLARRLTELLAEDRWSAETRRRLAEVAELLARAEGDEAAADQALDEIADALDDKALAERLAQALRDGELEEAAAELERLAKSMDAGRAESLAEALENAARRDDRLSRDLRQAAGRMEQRPTGGREALERAASRLREAGRDRGDRQSLDDASRRMAELDRRMSERDGSTAASADAEGQNQGEGEAPPSTAMLPGRGQARADAAGRADQPGGGSESPGHLSGMPGDAGRPTAVPPPIDVAKRPEELLLEAGEEPSKAELVDQQSRAAQARVGYEAVSARTRYAEADAVEPNALTDAYRLLVRSYFQAVGPRTRHDY